MVKQDNAEKKGKLFQCPGRITMSARNRVSKARGTQGRRQRSNTRHDHQPQPRLVNTSALLQKLCFA
jgi:hypothetical protein